MYRKCEATVMLSRDTSVPCEENAVARRANNDAELLKNDKETRDKNITV